MGYKMSWERETSEEKFESIQHGYSFIEDEDELEDDIDLDDVEDVEFDLDEWEEM